MTLDSSELVAGHVIEAGHVLQFYNLLVGTMTDQPVTLKNLLTLTRTAGAAPSTRTYLGVTGVADTAVTAEANDVYFNLARTLQFAAASVPAQQRAIRIEAPTYSSTGIATLASASTVYISGAPVSGSNLTITDSIALLIASGNLRMTTGNLLFGAAGTVGLMPSTGSPEGVLTAGIGSLALDISNGAFYIKVTGTGNTGWSLQGGNTSTIPQTLTPLTEAPWGNPWIGAVSTDSGGVFTSGAASALFFPVYVPIGCTVKRVFWINGATVNGNTDVGIYNSSYVRQIASTPTAQSGVSAMQIVDVANTALTAGNYYLAIGTSSATATYREIESAAHILRGIGAFAQAVGTLPATATPAAITGVGSVEIPFFGVELGTIT